MKKALLTPLEYLECAEDFWHGNYTMKDCPVFPLFSTLWTVTIKRLILQPSTDQWEVGIGSAELLQDWAQVFSVE